MVESFDRVLIAWDRMALPFGGTWSEARRLELNNPGEAMVQASSASKKVDRQYANPDSANASIRCRYDIVFISEHRLGRGGNLEKRV